jgi:hypothetical protein
MSRSRQGPDIGKQQPTVYSLSLSRCFPLSRHRATAPSGSTPQSAGWWQDRASIHQDTPLHESNGCGARQSNDSLVAALATSQRHCDADLSIKNSRVSALSAIPCRMRGCWVESEKRPELSIRRYVESNTRWKTTIKNGSTNRGEMRCERRPEG